MSTKHRAAFPMSEPDKEMHQTSGPTPWRVLLIGDNAEQLGILPLFEAHALAKKLGREIIEIAPQGNPPIWRLKPISNSK
jgi:translation initiation factor IF-3